MWYSFKIYQSYLYQLKIIIFLQEMSHLNNFAFGLASVPRQTMPSMYQILSWNEQQSSQTNFNQKKQSLEQNQIAKVQAPQRGVKENIIENISEVKSQHETCKGKQISKSCTKHYQLYQYKESHLKAESQPRLQTSKSKVEISRQVVKPPPKRLDPSNQEDLKEIEARKKRIKSFELVTRDLPNSAFTTYYGKPAFEAYGRGGSNTNLLSHNVMPHKGDNHPKSVQSYYSALIKGKKTASSVNVTHVPRKPIQEIKVEVPMVEEQIVNLPLQKPDLINNIRFTAHNPNEKKDIHIPTNKVHNLKKTKTKSKRSDRKSNKQREPLKSKQKDQINDGLKYMNNRENLLKIMENKRLNSSKLAYKVTECYPCEWENKQKLKESAVVWKNVTVAGLPSRKCEKVSDLINNKQSSI